MNIVLDLDYTLLDTERFKEALASVFAECGIDKQRFLESYRQTAEHDPPAYDYDLGRHIDMLSGELTCDVQSLKNQVFNIISRTEDFLYDGAKEFVASLRGDGFRIILMTMGNASWQEQKVKSSGLRDLFDEVVLVRTNKEDYLSKLEVLDGPVIFVNDNSDEVKSMKKVEPSFHYIIKRGPKGVREDIDVVVLDTFEEILQEIRSIIS